MDSSDDISSLLALVNSHLRQMSVEGDPTRSTSSSVYENNDQSPTPNTSSVDPVDGEQIANTINVCETSQQQEAEVEDMEINAEQNEGEKVSCSTVALTRQHMGYQVDAIIDQANEHLKVMKSQQKKSVSFNKEISRIIIRMDNIILDPNEVPPPLPFKLKTINLEFGSTKKKGFGKMTCSHQRPMIMPQPKLPFHLSSLLKATTADMIKEKFRHEASLERLKKAHFYKKALEEKKKDTDM